MSELYQKSAPHRYGDETISAMALNRIRDAMPRTIKGDGVQVKRYADRIVIQNDEPFIRKSDELQLFVVIEEFTDLLYCVSYAYYLEIQAFDAAAGDDNLDTNSYGTGVWVAKPEWLQPSAYSGKSFTTNVGKVILESYSTNERTSNYNHEFVDPAYFPGAVIVARNMQTGYTVEDDEGIEQPVLWADINTAGRRWKSIDPLIEISSTTSLEPAIFEANLYKRNNTAFTWTSSVPIWAVDLNGNDELNLNFVWYLAHFIGFEAHGPYYVNIESADIGSTLGDTSKWISTPTITGTENYVLDIIPTAPLVEGGYSFSGAPTDFTSKLVFIVTDPDNDVAGNIVIVGGDIDDNALNETLPFSGAGTYTTTNSFKTIDSIDTTSVTSSNNSNDEIQAYIEKYTQGVMRLHSGHYYIATVDITSHVTPNSDSDWYDLGTSLETPSSFDSDSSYTAKSIVQEVRATYTFNGIGLTNQGSIQTDPATGEAIGPNYIFKTDVSSTIDGGVTANFNAASSSDVTLQLNVSDATVNTRGIVSTGNQTWIGNKGLVGTYSWYTDNGSGDGASISLTGLIHTVGSSSSIIVTGSGSNFQAVSPGIWTPTATGLSSDADLVVWKLTDSLTGSSFTRFNGSLVVNLKDSGSAYPDNAGFNIVIQRGSGVSVFEGQSGTLLPGAQALGGIIYNLGSGSFATLPISPSDISAGGASTGNLLAWNGSNWAPIDPSTLYADAGANKILAWDDTDNSIGYWTLGSGLSYDHSTHTLSSTGSGSITIGDPVSGGSPNYVLYIDGSGDLAGDAHFQFDPSGAGVSISDAVTASVQIGNGTEALRATDGTNTVYLADYTYAINAINGDISTSGDSDSTFRWAANSTAPDLNSGTPTMRYGGDTNYLGDPDDWLLVRVGSNLRVIPAYIRGA